MSVFQEVLDYFSKQVDEGFTDPHPPEPWVPLNLSDLMTDLKREDEISKRVREKLDEKIDRPMPLNVNQFGQMMSSVMTTYNINVMGGGGGGLSGGVGGGMGMNWTPQWPESNVETNRKSDFVKKHFKGGANGNH